MNIKKLQNKGRSVVLFGEDKHIKYLTGTDAFCLVIPGNKPAYIISPLMEYERIKKNTKVRVKKIEKGKRLFQHIAEIEKAKNIAINYNYATINTYKAIKKSFRKRKIKDISSELYNLREIKTKEEIKKIKKACNITDKILQETIKKFKTFKTEKDVEKFLTKRTTEEECELSFSPVIASGKNASMPHHKPKNVKIKKGFCVIDFGVKYEGYCADVTRTIYVGKPNKKEKEAYNNVLNVQKECIKMLKPGTKCSKIYEHAYNKLGEAFCHGLGHGIGIEIHELPNLKPGKEIIKKNTITTVEPGVYYEGKYGIRIEDDVLVASKPIVITKTNKKLIQI